MTQEDAQVEAPAEAAGRREWLALAVLALPVLVLSVDVSVLLLALPAIAADLGATSTAQLWIADIYGFTLAGLLVAMGSIGDRFGRRRLLLGGAVAFAALSVVAAFASSPEMLIAVRAALGIAGASIMPTTLGIVATMFTVPRQRETAIALIFGCFLVGGALGPVVGGVLLASFWWGAVFLVAVPVMALLVLVGPRLLPESSDPSGGGVDVASVALILGGVLGFVAGVKLLARDGWTPIGVLLAMGGLAVGAGFVIRQLRLSQPLLDVRLLRLPSVAVGMCLAVLGGVVLGGTFLVVTQYLQLVLGLDPLTAGLWMMIPTAAMAVGTISGPRLAKRLGIPGLIFAGLLLAAGGLATLTQVDAAGGLPPLVISLSVALFGFGLPGGVGINLIVGAVPPEQSGAASGMSSTGQELGVALGLATLGSAALAVYRSRMAGSVTQTLPPPAAARVGDNLAGALATGDDMIIAAAREAFTSGLHLVVGLGAAVVLALCVLVVITRRSLAAPSDQPESANAMEGTDA